MDKPAYIYRVRVPLPGWTPEQIAHGDGYFTLCMCHTAQSVGEVVSAVLPNLDVCADHVRIERIPAS
jgi:hypothetical protein